MIHIYYGYGKGKTSSAIGAGMRAYGAEMSVALVQFLKDNKSSELSCVPFNIFTAPESISFNPDRSYELWVKKALDYVASCRDDVIILDEFLDVIDWFVPSDEAERIILSLKNKEVIITGHKKIDALFDKADYITFFDKIKHPYDDGVSARKGIEY